MRHSNRRKQIDIKGCRKVISIIQYLSLEELLKYSQGLVDGILQAAVNNNGDGEVNRMIDALKVNNDRNIALSVRR